MTKKINKLKNKKKILPAPQKKKKRNERNKKTKRERKI